MKWLGCFYISFQLIMATRSYHLCHLSYQWMTQYLPRHASKITNKYKNTCRMDVCQSAHSIAASGFWSTNSLWLSGIWSRIVDNCPNFPYNRLWEATCVSQLESGSYANFGKTGYISVKRNDGHAYPFRWAWYPFNYFVPNRSDRWIDLRHYVGFKNKSMSEVSACLS